MDGFLILNKEIDQSVLREGFSIPNRFHDLFFQKLGFSLAHGESRTIHLLLDGQEYPVTFKNLGFNKAKYSDRTDILQIRYAPGSALAVRLREKFSSTQSLVTDYLATRTDKKRLVIPEENKECIGYKTDARSFIDGYDNVMLYGAPEIVLHNEEELRAFFGQ